MSYTKTEREEIAANIREFLQGSKKEKFETIQKGKEVFLVRREVSLSWYERDRLENVARDVEGRITHYEE